MWKSKALPSLRVGRCMVFPLLCDRTHPHLCLLKPTSRCATGTAGSPRADQGLPQLHALHHALHLLGAHTQLEVAHLQPSDRIRHLRDSSRLRHHLPQVLRPQPQSLAKEEEGRLGRRAVPQVGQLAEEWLMGTRGRGVRQLERNASRSMTQTGAGPELAEARQRTGERASACAPLCPRPLLTLQS